MGLGIECSTENSGRFGGKVWCCMVSNFFNYQWHLGEAAYVIKMQKITYTNELKSTDSWKKYYEE